MEVSADGEDESRVPAHVPGTTTMHPGPVQNDVADWCSMDTDAVEADFRKLQGKNHRTSTPFVGRTSSWTILNGDSGVDTLCFDFQVSATTSTPGEGQSLSEVTSGRLPQSSFDLSRPQSVAVSKYSGFDSTHSSGPSFTSDYFSLGSQSDSHEEPMETDPRYTTEAVRRTTKSHISGTIEARESATSDSALKEDPGQSTPETPDFNSVFMGPSAQSSLQSFSGFGALNSLASETSWCSPATVPATSSHPKHKLTSTPKDSTDIEVSMQEMLKHFSPSVLDRLIGRKMGLEHVDVISELHNRSIGCATSLVFQYLSPGDLCSCCLVSEEWKAAVQSDPVSVQRRKAYLERPPQVQKENQHSKSEPHLLRLRRGLTKGKTRLGTIQPTAAKSLSPVKEALAASPILMQTPRHQLFWEEARKCLEGESIRVCPRCNAPARVHNVQERGRCSNPSCAYDFCILCAMLFHGAKPCAAPITPTKKHKAKENIIGSRKSRRKLRRL